VKLTHHTLKNIGVRPMVLLDDEYPKLEPITEAGSGVVRAARLRQRRPELEVLYMTGYTDDGILRRG
jgi:hypothetical protein